MKRILAAALCLAASPVLADMEARKAQGDVITVAKNLEVAISEAGATIFATVDHGAGAASVNRELADAQVVIFGNPELGTQAMQDDIRAGLYLPLRMLVYADGDGQTWIAWEDPEELFDDLSIDDDAPYLQKMEEAMENFAAIAAE